MKNMRIIQPQKGIALVVSLLFLLVVTIISISAATNSSQGLKMASNMQDSYNSFQSAEAGIFAALSMVASANDPFTRKVEIDPFATLTSSENPLRDLRDGVNSVTTQIFLTAAGRPCPRPPGETGGSSIGTFDCDYYRIESEHDVANRARTKVELGVVKTVIGENG
ncbi:MAG: type IV pilus assembly protein PilX [Halioglobus sp.]|jgi:type IV pilus assembly protein PilX